MTNEKGLPVEYKILPGSIADIKAFKDFLKILLFMRTEHIMTMFLKMY